MAICNASSPAFAGSAPACKSTFAKAKASAVVSNKTMVAKIAS